MGHMEPTGKHMSAGQNPSMQRRRGRGHSDRKSLLLIVYKKEKTLFVRVSDPFCFSVFSEPGYRR